MTDLHQSTRLGDLLVERKIITRAQLLQAIELQQVRRLDAVHSNKPGSYRQELGEVLIELGFINRAQLKTGLGWQRRLRKATAAMVFIAPMLTACGGGGGGGSGGSPSNYTPPASQVSQNISSVSNSQGTSSAPVTTPPGTNPGSHANSSVPVVDAPSSSTISSSPKAQSSSSKASQIAVPPVTFSSSSFSSSVISSLPKSSSSSSINSSSSSSKAPSSSLASSSSGLAQINGPVQIYWNAPTERENGDYLDITEVGGYELRYKRKSDIYYTRVVINDAFTDAYYFDHLEGEYEFQIAAFDKIGLYSSFVPINNSRDSH